MKQSKPKPADMSLVQWTPDVEAPEDSPSGPATSAPERAAEARERPVLSERAVEPVKRPVLSERTVQFWKTWRGWLLLGLFLLILGLVLARLAWVGVIDAGLGEYVPPTPGTQRAKTLWDWMELLLVPGVLAIGAALFIWVTDRRAHEAEDRHVKEQQEIVTGRAGETALQTYLDRMVELLKAGLLERQRGDTRRSIGRAETLTVLRQLDGERKGLLLQFLYESGLVGMWTEKEGRQEAVVDLSDANLSGANLTMSIPSGATPGEAYRIGASLVGANLSRAILVMANLEGVNLREANLTGANLSGAKLGGANLWDANLSRANLSEASLNEANLSEAILIMANLSEANLSGTNLSEANVVGANLTSACLEGANLSGANLTWAILKGAQVTDEQLARANSLQGATLPDGTKHE